jgi:hypothetical protein
MPNLKFALRTLFKTPFVAIVSLALGIGANAAILEKIQMPFTGIAARLPSVRTGADSRNSGSGFHRGR